MTEPSTQILRAAAAAARSMADRDTPFVEEEWYAVGFAGEIGRALLRRRVLGRPIVLFRRLDGAVCALEDRCVHRSFPLSAGILDGDTLVCGYHGFRYDADGDVIEIPSQPRCQPGLGVRRYPVHEAGPLVWIWMGRGVPAAPPALDWLADDGWVSSQGRFDLAAHYLALHENLMDLSHLSFVHAGSFGTPDYARAPISLEEEGEVVAVTRCVAPTRLPPVWAKPTGIGHGDAVRLTRSEYRSPGVHVVHGTFSDGTAADARPFRIRTCHVITPQDRSSTRYLVVHSRDFALDQPWVTDFMHEQLWAAFREDVVALELLERGVAEGGSGPEVSVGADRPAIRVRRTIARRARMEQEAAAAAEPEAGAA